MNIIDVDIDDILEKYKGQDKLETMYNLQKNLAVGYGVEPKSIDTKEGQNQIKHLVFCCVEEMFEMTNTLKNRPWTKTEVPVDRQHFLDELADMLAFFMELLVMTGLTVDEIFEIYLRKLKINRFRRESGY